MTEQCLIKQLRVRFAGEQRSWVNGSGTVHTHVVAAQTGSVWLCRFAQDEVYERL